MSFQESPSSRVTRETGSKTTFSTAEVAQLMGRSEQWVYWGLRDGVFLNKKGEPLEPYRTSPRGRRRFTFEDLRDIVGSCHSRGNFTVEEAEGLVTRIAAMERGDYVEEDQNQPDGDSRDREDVHHEGDSPEAE